MQMVGMSALQGQFTLCSMYSRNILRLAYRVEGCLVLKGCCYTLVLVISLGLKELSIIKSSFAFRGVHSEVFHRSYICTCVLR